MNKQEVFDQLKIGSNKIMLKELLSEFIDSTKCLKKALTELPPSFTLPSKGAD